MITQQRREALDGLASGASHVVICHAPGRWVLTSTRLMSLLKVATVTPKWLGLGQGVQIHAEEFLAYPFHLAYQRGLRPVFLYAADETKITEVPREVDAILAFFLDLVRLIQSYDRECWSASIERACRAKMDVVMANREKLVTAWIAETGLMPSESVLVEQRMGDGTILTWVDRRDNPVAAPPFAVGAGPPRD